MTDLKKYSEHRHGRAVAKARVPNYRAGGAVKAPKMTAGAKSGVGRLQKIK